MVSDRAQFTTTLVMGLDASQLTNGLSGVNADMLRTERRSETLSRSVVGLGRDARSAGADISRGGREIAQLGDQARGAASDVDRLEGRLNNLRGVVGTLGAAFAGAFTIGAGLDRHRRLQQGRLDAPLLGQEDVQRTIAASDAIGIDEGRVLDTVTETARRIQEATTGASLVIQEDLTAAGVAYDDFAARFQSAPDAAGQLEVLINAVRSAENPLAVMEALGGDAANVVGLLANDAEQAARFMTAFAEATVQSEAETQRLADAQESMAQLTNSLSILAGTFAGALSPAIDLAVSAIQPLATWFGRLTETSPALATAISVGLVGATLAATVSMFGLTGAIRGMTAALLANPIGAVVGIILAVAVPAILYLSDRLGGFGELWKTVWDGIVVVTLVAVRAALTPLGLFLETLNAIGRGISAISGGSIQVPEIPNPVRAIDAEIGRRVGAIQGRFDQADGAGEERSRGGVQIQTHDVYNFNGIQNPEEIAEAVEETRRETFALGEVGI